MRLKGKVAIVTGAGSGIGKAIAEVFAREGAKVVVAECNASAGQRVVDDIVRGGGDAHFVRSDVSLEDDVKNLINATLKEYGRIDVLVNNAGVNFVKNFEDTASADWDRVIHTDLRGAFLCTRYAIIEMQKSGGGSIINIGSVHTLATLPGAAPYAAAKWGVVGMSKALAAEFATRNIRVNVISPGLIDTQIWADIQAAAEDLEECLSHWRANIPAGRVGTCQEIANVAVFLATDDSSYVTGANVLVDGGMTSQLISKERYASRSLEGEKRSGSA